MYSAKPFRIDQRDEMCELIRAVGFASLVVSGTDGITAAHVPLHLESAGDSVTLRGHVARANPIWQAVSEPRPALAIFLGANGYVTPQWYPSKQAHGRVVPTWNYIAVHAHGPLRAVDDVAWFRSHLNALVDHHEAHTANPWAMNDAPEDYLHRMMQGIVGLELAVSRMEGIRKLSQNRMADDHAGVIAGLTARGGEDDVEMAHLMSGRTRDGSP